MPPIPEKHGSDIRTLSWNCWKLYAVTIGVLAIPKEMWHTSVLSLEVTSCHQSNGHVFKKIIPLPLWGAIENESRRFHHPGFNPQNFQIANLGWYSHQLSSPTQYIRNFHKYFLQTFYIPVHLKNCLVRTIPIQHSISGQGCNPLKKIRLQL